MSEITPRMRACLIAPFLAASTLAAATFTEERIGEPGTETITGTRQNRSDGKAVFSVTMSTRKLFSLAGARKAAIIFDGNTDPDRLCPVMGDRPVELWRPSAKTLIILTEASDEEKEAVAQKGCVIAPVPRIMPWDIKNGTPPDPAP